MTNESGRGSHVQRKAAFHETKRLVSTAEATFGFVVLQQLEEKRSIRCDSQFFFL